MNQSGRLQLALFTASPEMYPRLFLLDGQIESETHLPRLADVPREQSDAAVRENVRQMLRNYQLPFAIVAVTGTGEQIRHAGLVFLAARKRVPTMLIMCRDGYRHMHQTVDVPFFAHGHPPESYDIAGVVLLDKEEAFPDYDASKFGEPTYLPLENWRKENLGYLAEHVRRVAKPARGTVVC